MNKKACLGIVAVMLAALVFADADHSFDWYKYTYQNARVSVFAGQTYTTYPVIWQPNKATTTCGVKVNTAESWNSYECEWSAKQACNEQCSHRAEKHFCHKSVTSFCHNQFRTPRKR